MYKENTINLDSLSKQRLLPEKIAQDENPYVNAFWKWWPELYKNLEVFRMTGGEPLMDSNTFKVLDYVYENPNAWLEMSLTSNMCPPKPILMDMLISKLQKMEEIQIWEDPQKFNPNSGNNYQSEKASEAISNGGFFGMGIGEGKLNSRIPEAHTDYIISVIAEEFGIIIVIIKCVCIDYTMPCRKEFVLM